MGTIEPSKFRFQRHDNIGAMAAEEDDHFLEECFLDTGDLDLLINPQSKRVIVLGRTGSGKSALLGELVRQKGDAVVVLNPESLALSYLSNSTVLGFFESIGVNLDPFFKLLWRHVLTVEILRRHFREGRIDREKWSPVVGQFQLDSKVDSGSWVRSGGLLFAEG